MVKKFSTNIAEDLEDKTVCKQNRVTTLHKVLLLLSLTFLYHVRYCD